MKISPHSIMVRSKFLAEAESASHFISLLCNKKLAATVGVKALSFSDLARATGLKSRGFIRDLSLGKRKVTFKTLEILLKNLALRGDIAKFLKLLVERDNFSKEQSSLDLPAIESKLEELRKRLKERRVQRVIKDEKAIVLLLETPECTRIYSGLGSFERGATLKEIECRTELSRAKIVGILGKMIQLGLVEKSLDGKSYIPLNFHLHLSENRKIKAFQNDYLRVLESCKEKFKKKYADPGNLFFCSTFSVSKAKLPAFKLKLRKLMLDFVDTCEEAEGDSIVELSLGFFN